MIYFANLGLGHRGRGPLAQLAEQLTLNEPVPGSSPGRPPKKSDMEVGEVSEPVDERDLGSRAERRGGSNPPFPTTGVRLAPRPHQLGGAETALTAGGGSVGRTTAAG